MRLKECLYCGEFTRKDTDICPWCGSEGLVAMQEDDYW